MKSVEIYKEITGEDHRIVDNIKHDVSNFVDNSTNSIGGNDLMDIKEYTENYMKLV